MMYMPITLVGDDDDDEDDDDDDDEDDGGGGDDDGGLTFCSVVTVLICTCGTC